ncbi:copper amine oxidase [Paenibacillus sp. Z3-2]
MKKIVYIAGGILIGIVFSTAGGAFADTIKSVVGKKVTGEYNIVVNNQSLSEKGAVIDSKANVPARALSEALGAEVKVEGRTIYITSDGIGGQTSSDAISDHSSNKYVGDTRSSLEELKKSIQDKILSPAYDGKKKLEAQIAELKSLNADDATTNLEKQLSQYNADIKKYEAEIKLIDEVLLTAK